MEQNEIKPENHNNNLEISPKSPIEPVKIKKAKKYELISEQDIYYLLIELYLDNSIHFTLRKAKNICIYQYDNKFNYDELIKLFLLEKEKNNKVDDVLNFIDLSLENKRYHLNHIEEKNTVILEIKKENLDEKQYEIELNIKKIPQEEIIGLLIEEINDLKNNTKENIKCCNKINELNEIIKENEIRIKNLEDKIKSLDEENNKFKQNKAQILKEDNNIKNEQKNDIPSDSKKENEHNYLINNIKGNKLIYNTTNNFIKSTDLRLPSYLFDLSYDDPKNK